LLSELAAVGSMGQAACLVEHVWIPKGEREVSDGRQHSLCLWAIGRRLGRYNFNKPKIQPHHLCRTHCVLCGEPDRISRAHTPARSSDQPPAGCKQHPHFCYTDHIKKNSRVVE
jgi:hypothetical protein